MLALIGCNQYPEAEAGNVPNKDAVLSGLTAPQSYSLPAQSKELHTITLSCDKEAVTVTATSPWFGVVGGSAEVAKGKRTSVSLWFEPNLTTKERTSNITVTGVKSGASVTIPVSQSPYFTTITESLPARFEAQTSSYDSTMWESDGICSPKNSEAILCAVSKSGNQLSYSTKSGASIKNMGKGDYLLYAIPTKSVAAGEQLDFMCTIAAAEYTSPKYFIFEYWDNGSWRSVVSSLRTAEEDPSIKYSLYCKYFESEHYTTFAQSFSLSKSIKDECVKVRLRCLSDGGGTIRIPSSRGYMGMYLINYPKAAQQVDSKKILFIGNSFTYYYGTSFMFKEIARSEGHQVDAVISVKGGQEFSEHLRLELSQDAIKRGGYDYAFLQDTSPNPATYAEYGTASILDACKQINALTLKYSPSCQIIYECTWACPYDDYRGYGSYEKLDQMLNKGFELLIPQLTEDVWVSPIGDGFRIAREQGLDLLYTDDRHQNRAGAYMKACINYLFLYKQPFTDSVSDCGLDSAKAAKIRSIAYQVVFGK